MTYEEIKDRVGYLIIALANPVTTSIHNYTNHPSNETIKETLIEIRDALNELIENINNN